MKHAMLSLLLMLALNQYVHADMSEAECLNTINMTIEAMRMQEIKTGTEANLRGLTIDDIREMEKSQGVCPTAMEINKRTNQ
jgi:hypothetical protein